MCSFCKKSDGQRRLRKSKSKSKCKNYLRKKIAINMEEFKKKRFVSPAQAIAVAYSQVRKKHPACKRMLNKTKLKKNSKKMRVLYLIKKSKK